MTLQSRPRSSKPSRENTTSSGPTEFAKKVIEFGDLLGRQGGSFSPAEKEHALAEYSFLQDRLSFWLGYDYKPPTAQGNLLSAALTLFPRREQWRDRRGRPFAQSMLDVAAASGCDVRQCSAARSVPRWLTVEHRRRRRPQTRRRRSKELADSSTTVRFGIDWDIGIEERTKIEEYIERQDPNAKRLRPKHPTFDNFNAITGEAISAKSLRVQDPTYTRNPKQVFWALKRYVDKAAAYNRSTRFDLDYKLIKFKTIQLFVYGYPSPEQRRYLYAAIIYGKEHGVRIVITRTPENESDRASALRPVG